MKKPKDKSLLDLNHSFFDPLWRRVVITIILFGWSLFEYANGAVIWSLLFFVLGIIAGYNFFFASEEKRD